MKCVRPSRPADHRRTVHDQKPLRILVLADAFPVLSETFVVDHVLALAKAGCQVTLLARKVNKGATTVLQEYRDSIQAIEIQKHSVKSVLECLVMLARFKPKDINVLSASCASHAARLKRCEAVRQEYDLVHAHFGNNGVSGILANPAWATRMIVDFHGHDATSTPHKWGWRLYRDVLKDCHAICHSTFVHRRLNEETSLLIHRVALGVDHSRFTPGEKHDAWTRPLRLVFVGRLVEQKGIIPALLALSILTQRRPELDARLTIAGDGPLTQEVRRMIVSLDLQDRVTDPAPVRYADIPQLLSGADICVMPSQISDNGWQEAFGRVAIEAMASGVPVIGTNSGGLADTIGSGGVVSKGHDGTSLAEGIIHLMESASPKRWSERAILQASHHTLDVMTDEYLNISRMVAEERDAP